MVYGRTVGYFHLVNRLTALWNLSSDPEFFDVGHGFYIAKCRNKGDANQVLSNGPYSVAGPFVMLKQWCP
ncbi:hypothetical protein LINGRAHAP2_LOCUS20151 [Linum grandiflorum]